MTMFLTYSIIKKKGYAGPAVAALLVGRSQDRSPVVSLGIFFRNKSMCPESTQPLKMSTRIFLGVKAAGA